MTARVLPDTCAWVDFLNGRKSALAAGLEHALLNAEVHTCGIVLYELMQGIRDEKEGDAVRKAMQALTHLEMAPALWLRAAALSSALRKRGKIIPMSDILLSAIALEHDLALLTVDRHFDAVPGLKRVG